MAGTNDLMISNLERKSKWSTESKGSEKSRNQEFLCFDKMY